MQRSMWNNVVAVCQYGRLRGTLTCLRWSCLVDTVPMWSVRSVDKLVISELKLQTGPVGWIELVEYSSVVAPNAFLQAIFTVPGHVARDLGDAGLIQQPDCSKGVPVRAVRPLPVAWGGGHVRDCVGTAVRSLVRFVRVSLSISQTHKQ